MRQRAHRFASRLKQEVQKAWEEEHTAHETAASFALGTFITILPSFPIGVAVLIVMAARVERMNKVALFTPALVFNPFVKTAMYGLGYSVGEVLWIHGAGPFGVVILTMLQFASGIVVVAAGTALLTYLVLLQTGRRMH